MSFCAPTTTTHTHTLSLSRALALSLSFARALGVSSWWQRAPKEAKYDSSRKFLIDTVAELQQARRWTAERAIEHLERVRGTASLDKTDEDAQEKERLRGSSKGSNARLRRDSDPTDPRHFLSLSPLALLLSLALALSLSLAIALSLSFVLALSLSRSHSRLRLLLRPPFCIL